MLTSLSKIQRNTCLLWVSLAHFYLMRLPALTYWVCSMWIFIEVDVGFKRTFCTFLTNPLTIPICQLHVNCNKSDCRRKLFARTHALTHAHTRSHAMTLAFLTPSELQTQRWEPSVSLLPPRSDGAFGCPLLISSCISHFLKKNPKKTDNSIDKEVKEKFVCLSII